MRFVGYTLIQRAFFACALPDLSFFFKSRRRDTRCLSAWSSDVCSSDLLHRATGDGLHSDGPSATKHWHPLGSSVATAIHNAAHQVVTTVEAGGTVHDFVTVTGQPRSEERRVGKEGRSRWSPYH